MKLADMAGRILAEFAGLRQGERVLILAETETPEAMKRALYSAASDIAGANVALATYDRKPAYTHPPEPLPQAILGADLVVCLDIYLSHTDLDERARAAGVRFLNLHPANPRVLQRAVFGVDYTAIRKRARKLAALFAASKRGLITCPHGTRLEFGIDAKREVSIGNGYARKRGEYATLPNGKVKVPVVRGSMTGTFVVNGVIIPPVNELSELVTLHFKNSRVVRIAGKRQARAYARFLASFRDPGMFVLDHLTFGFNPRATLRQPPRPAFSSEAEKVMGSINIGLGRAGLKGKQHTDVVTTGASLTIDGRPFIVAGRYAV